MLGAAAAAVVGLYQRSVGRLVPRRCRFHPSCSEYARAALLDNGLLFGGIQAVWRLLRCGPWSAGGIDEARRIGSAPGSGPLRRLIAGRRAEATRG